MAEFFVGQVFIDDYPQEASLWCNDETERCYIKEIDPLPNGQRRFKIFESDPPVETPELKQARFEEAIQNALDAFARTKGYDNIASACSYANSTNATYAAEAEYCIDLRDRTWQAWYAILADGMPSYEEEEDIIADLPIATAAWPEKA